MPLGGATASASVINVEDRTNSISLSNEVINSTHVDNDDTPAYDMVDIESPKSMSSKILSFNFMRSKSHLQQEKADKLHLTFDQLIDELRKYVNNYIHTNHSNHSVALRSFVQQWDIHMKKDGEFGYLNHPNFWRHQIGDAMDSSEEIIASIKDIPKHTRGAHLMRHFFIDILGRTTKEAYVFDTKSKYYFGENRLVSTEIKWLTIIFVIFLNIFCFYQCILYGAVKGYQWQMNWITLCFCTLLFLFTIEMTYEAVMISFVIPSQVLPKVRAAQATMNTALVKYACSIQCTQYHTNIITRSSDDFSASTYLFPSVIAASRLSDLPESQFILSYVDPLPHSFADKLKKRQSSRRLLNNSNPNFFQRVFGLCSSWTLLSLLIHIGSFPVLLQRCFVVLPLPFFCSAVTALMIAFLRLSPYLYIPLTLLFVALLVYGLYSTSVFVFEMVDKLKDSQVKEADDRLKVETSLDRMSMRFDSSLSLRRLSSRRKSSYTFGDKVDGVGVSMQRRFTKPRVSISEINALGTNIQASSSLLSLPSNMNTRDHDKDSTSSGSSEEESDKGDTSSSRPELNVSNASNVSYASNTSNNSITSNAQVTPNSEKVKAFKPKGKISLQRTSTSRRMKSKRSSKVKQKTKSSQILVERPSIDVVIQSEESGQENANATQSLDISNVVWDSDSSSDDSHNTSRSPEDRPTVVKVVRSKPKKLVRKSTSKKLKRTSTNKNRLKKQKSLSLSMLSAEESSKIKTKATSRNQLVRQGTSKKWKNKKL